MKAKEVRLFLSCLLLMFLLSGVCLIIGLAMVGVPVFSLFAQEEIHAKNAYAANWGLFINEDCREVYFSESESRALGEGQRCSVLTGHYVYGIEDRSTPTSLPYVSAVEMEMGYDTEADLDAFITHVCEELKIPAEYCALTQNNRWVSLERPDGSCMVLIIVEDPMTKQQTVYITEELR